MQSPFLFGPNGIEMPDDLADLPPIFTTPNDRLSRLRILATSDLHAHITPWDYHSNRSSPAIGLARTASLIAKAREQVECSVLVDNGDFLQGSPMGDVEALRAMGGRMVGSRLALHPMIAAMNALGYDAATLGNHEFSHGLAFLLQHLEGAEFPVVSANLARALGDTPLLDDLLVPPTLIVHRMLRDGSGVLRPLKIGIIGLAPPQTPLWDHAKLGNSLYARDILEAAAAHVPRLRAAGADVVLALSHSGIGVATPAPMMENASAALATVPGIDALVAGHTHLTFPSPDFPAATGIDPKGRLWGKPAVMPGFYGSHLGVIDLDLRWDQGRWQLVTGASFLRAIARRGPSGALRALTRSAPDIMALSLPAHQATRAWAQRQVGDNPVSLHSYFAVISANPAVRLIARAQAAHVARALRGGPYGHLPVLAAAAPFHAGGRGGPENFTYIAAGRLTMRHVFDLYPHPNTIAALLVTGADLQNWLERSFSQFAQVPPGSHGVELVDSNFPSFNFDTIEGLTWGVDLATPPRCDNRGGVMRPRANRIVALAHQGVLVATDQQFVLATNSYRANGSGGFSGARPENVILSGPQSSRDILVDHIIACGGVTPAGPPNWRFCGMPGTSVLFDSAPVAPAHLDDLLPLRAEPLGLTPHGFRRFRLHL